MSVMSGSEPERNAAPATTFAHAGDPPQRPDVRIAELVARVVGDVPGVAGLSPGHGVTAATHGPGKAVVGVVVHHGADDSLTLEVHVVVAQAHLESMRAHPRASAATPEADQAAVLPALADAIRRHITRALPNAEIRVPTAIDVYFDDVQ